VPAGATAEIYFNSNSAISETNPQLLNLNNITIGSGGLLKFPDWTDSASDKGDGPTRIVTTLGIGTIIDNIQLGVTTLDKVVIARSSTGNNIVLLPFDKLFTWDGKGEGSNSAPVAKDQWIAGNWQDNNGAHSQNIVPGESTNGPGSLVQFTQAAALYNLSNKTIYVNRSVYSGELRFSLDAAAAGNTLTFAGSGTFFMDSGASGLETATTIRNEGSLGINFDVPVTGNYDSVAGTKSGTLRIVQDGAGNITFNRTVSGPYMDVHVTGEGTGAVIFNAENSFGGSFTLGDDQTSPSGPRVYVGANSALSQGELILNKGVLGVTGSDITVTLGNKYTLNGAPGDVTFTATATSPDKQTLILAGIGSFTGAQHTITVDTTPTGMIIFGNRGGTPSSTLSSSTDNNAVLTLTGKGHIGIAAALPETHTLRVNYTKTFDGSDNINNSNNVTLLSASGYAVFNSKLEILNGIVEVAGAIGENGDYKKDFILGENGTFRYTGAADQTLSGKIMPDSANKYGTLEKETGSSTLTIAGNTILNRNPIFGDWMQKENPFQGTLDVKGGILKITGPLGTETETFDGGTPLAATYYHARYKGAMMIYSGELEFAYKDDYQYASGMIMGSGHLKINSGMPFYYTGNAMNFNGTTTITGGSSFHLNTALPYGSGAPGSAFTVKSGSALYVGSNGAKIYTKDFAMEANTTLVVNAKEFLINAPYVPDAPASIRFGENTGENVTFVFRISSEDVNGATTKLVFETGEVGKSGEVGVVLSPGKTLRWDVFGYIPQPSQNDYVILMSGLNTSQMLGSTSIQGSLNNNATGEALAKEIFTGTDEKIMEKFKVRFTIDGKLRIDLANVTSGVPEPGTYGLFSGVFIAGLALLHRRRKKKI
jgi:hypothetical protein